MCIRDRRNVVGKAVDVFLEAIVPLQRHFDANTVFFSGEVEDIRVDRRFVLVQIFNERLDAAFIVEVVFFAVTLVAQTNGNAGVEERQLTQTFPFVCATSATAKKTRCV